MYDSLNKLKHARKMLVAPMQKKDDLPGKIQKTSFCDFLKLFGMCAIIVIPFWYMYDAVWFSDILIWYMEWLGDK